MKKLFCLFTTIITIMSFAACGNDDIESGSMGQEISKTEISRQDEQSSEGESSFAEASEPVSEEASETVSEEISEPVSEEISEPISEPVSDETSHEDPQQSYDENPSYKLIMTHNIDDLAAKFRDVLRRMNSDGEGSAQMSDNVREIYSPLRKIFEEGYILDPTLNGVHAENDPELHYGAIEGYFNEDHTVSIVYQCETEKLGASIQVTYTNDEINSLMLRHGIEGFRMYYAGNEKKLSDYTTQEIADVGFDSIQVQNVQFGGKACEAIVYGTNLHDGTSRVTFMYAGKVIIVSYLYYDLDLRATCGANDVLAAIQFGRYDLNKAE